MSLVTPPNSNGWTIPLSNTVPRKFLTIYKKIQNICANEKSGFFVSRVNKKRYGSE
jgi:hypothetical protein